MYQRCPELLIPWKTYHLHTESHTCCLVDLYREINFQNCNCWQIFIVLVVCTHVIILESSQYLSMMQTFEFYLIAITSPADLKIV